MLFPCEYCKRYIRHDENRCPFCDAEAQHPDAIREGMPRGLSRREMVAFAAAAVATASCKKPKPTTPQPEPQPEPTASVEPQPQPPMPPNPDEIPDPKVVEPHRPQPDMPYGCVWADPDDMTKV